MVFCENRVDINDGGDDEIETNSTELEGEPVSLVEDVFSA